MKVTIRACDFHAATAHRFQFDDLAVAVSIRRLPGKTLMLVRLHRFDGEDREIVIPVRSTETAVEISHRCRGCIVYSVRDGYAARGGGYAGYDHAIYDGVCESRREERCGIDGVRRVIAAL